MKQTLKLQIEDMKEWKKKTCSVALPEVLDYLLWNEPEHDKTDKGACAPFKN